jgi:hypothetical protein
MIRPSDVNVRGRAYESSEDDDFVVDHKVAVRKRKQPERKTKAQDALELYRRSAPKANKRNRIDIAVREQVLPTETTLDVYTFLDRDTLICLQLTSRKAKNIVTQRMSAICLRPIYSVELSATDYGIHAVVVTGHRANKRKTISPGPFAPRFGANSYEQAVEWINEGLRFSAVCHSFTLSNVPINRNIISLFQKAAIVLKGLLNLTTVGFHEGTSPAMLLDTFQEIGDIRTLQGHLQEKHINDKLLESFARKGLWKSFPRSRKGSEYPFLTEKGILDFCREPNGRKRNTRQLKLSGAKVTNKFIVNLTETCKHCEHDDSIHIEIAGIPQQDVEVLEPNKVHSIEKYTISARFPIEIVYNASTETWTFKRRAPVPK